MPTIGNVNIRNSSIINSVQEFNDIFVEGDIFINNGTISLGDYFYTYNKKTTKSPSNYTIPQKICTNYKKS